MPDERRPRPSGRGPRPGGGSSGKGRAAGGGGRRSDDAGRQRGGRPAEGRPQRGGESTRRDPEQPFRPPRKASPRRPSLPEERPVIPRDAWRDLRATVPANVLDEVVKAVGAASEALESGDAKRATELLTWAKSAASRTATIREALGITHYVAGRYPEAHSELLTYRRLSGNADQNHLLADCARAMGRHEKVATYVDEMIAANVDADRVAEGLLVLAGDRADRGDLDGALTVLQRAKLAPDRVQSWHPRIWYLTADLLERMGRRGEARQYFEAIAAVDDEFGDVEERLAALED